MQKRIAPDSQQELLQANSVNQNNMNTSRFTNDQTRQNDINEYQKAKPRFQSNLRNTHLKSFKGSPRKKGNKGGRSPSNTKKKFSKKFDFTVMDPA